MKPRSQPGRGSPLARFAIRSHEQIARLLDRHPSRLSRAETSAVAKLVVALAPDRAADDSPGLLPGVPEIERMTRAVAEAAPAYLAELARMNSELHRLCGALIEEAAENAEHAVAPAVLAPEIERRAIRAVAKINASAIEEISRFQGVLEAAKPRLPLYLLAADENFFEEPPSAPETTP